MELLISRAKSHGAFDSESEQSPEVQFELFSALVAKWLPDGLWKLILSCSRAWFPQIVQKYDGICAFRSRASGFLALAADRPTWL